jgi:hypothetical protein
MMPREWLLALGAAAFIAGVLWVAAWLERGDEPTKPNNEDEALSRESLERQRFRNER